MDDEKMSSDEQDEAFFQAILVQMQSRVKPKKKKKKFPTPKKSRTSMAEKSGGILREGKRFFRFSRFNLGILRYLGTKKTYPQPSTSGLKPIKINVGREGSPMEIDAPSTSSSLSNATPRSAIESTMERKARHETAVMSRINELRRSGMWSQTRLPMCVDPPRNKTHWDFFLEEVVWMAADFKGERNYKRNAARKLSSAIAKQFRDKETEAERQEQRAIRESKKNCAAVAKMVRDFWLNVDKLVELRASEIIEAKKKKAMDKHLDFIVGQADKISQMVGEELTATSSACSIKSEEDDPKDVEFHINDDVESDDETIEKEEAIENVNYTDELNSLSKDSEMDIDDLLSQLPPGYLEQFRSQIAGRPPPPEELGEPPAKRRRRNRTSSPSPSSSEVTQESSLPATEENSRDGADTAESTTQESSASTSGVNVDFDKLASKNSEDRKQELTNIAEKASRFQPHGNTLDTAEVRTTTPSLIRGTLREYQLVGLDWLVALYEQQLNGILADEMGLGKTIQTISLLAHMACERSIWGPHLIVVPTSVILNWEMELKRWCPAFKVLTYFGSLKERAEKRKGWSKPNAFHVCITSYKLVTQDIRMFKKKAWQYFILDEAQNIKNFKSQRWQMLLNVRAHRRLLLTGTPLQNSLMELWSLMHFLMPTIFASHSDFQDWFSNPLNSMMEGSAEINQGLVQRLHKVLRPFLLRRLKSEVERQLPSKTEHVVKCPLSKRQRYLYDDFMLRRATREGLKSGNMSSVLNIVMQLRKCCNHPNLFEPRPVVSPLVVHPVRTVFPARVLDLSEDLPSGLLFGDQLLCDTPKEETVLIQYDGGEMRRPPEPPAVEGFHFVSPFDLPVPRKKPLFSKVKEEPLFNVSEQEFQDLGINSQEPFLLTAENKKATAVPVRLKTETLTRASAAKNRQNGIPASSGTVKILQLVTGKDGKRTVQPHILKKLPKENGVSEATATSSTNGGCKRKLVDEDFELPPSERAPLSAFRPVGSSRRTFCRSYYPKP
ncbi:hypothetical protein L596_022942 [Steinernema carpocapsae]|uniref:Helicase ATP-binding domain-containing protein n=1 Tax=Steinernema carpocapsae TaxID=34508 RepID=A0A4V5ZZ91_STECR|nr:hypothetical protein L596_022942 [Steinernema carpocapsae]